jgi:hypothetical protein
LDEENSPIADSGVEGASEYEQFARGSQEASVQQHAVLNDGQRGVAH